MREIVRQSHNFPHPGRIACCSACNSRPPATKALYTTCGNNTSIVSSSWWWACKCRKHVEQIISAIKHSVASSWFSSLRLYYDARTNIHQRIRVIFFLPPPILTDSERATKRILSFKRNVKLTRNIFLELERTCWPQQYNAVEKQPCFEYSHLLGFLFFMWHPVVCQWHEWV